MVTAIALLTEVVVERRLGWPEPRRWATSLGSYLFVHLLPLWVTLPTTVALGVIVYRRRFSAPPA